MLVFVLAAALVVTVAVALDRNARQSSWKEHTTALAGGARVGASSFESLRANLKVQATQLATSLPLQRAVVTGNEAELRRIAETRRARINVRGRTIGELAGAPRISTTATITDGVRVLATVTIALPLGDDVLTLLRQATPLPEHAGLLLVRGGTVIAGGPAGEPVRIGGGRVTLKGTEFAAQSAPLKAAATSLVAVEPVSAIDALSARYGRFVFLAAAFTLVLAGFLASRVARPLAQVVGDVARLTRQAHTDALTGLANRRELTARLADELERAARNGTSLSFVICDVDDFKAINDEYGHQTGDEAIKALASVLEASVRETDLPVRFGGEEFVVVLPGARLADARRAADTMRKAVAELEIPVRGGSISLTASFGVAAFPTYATAEALLAAADAALYQAKRAGKNRVATSTVQGEGEADEAPAAAPAPAR
ncbi:MAG: GGDEF domain-containing protein [Thermoleophilia bacterium]|nr:GGDEF domain-containing protein [Thermoleophilia bacterium]